MDVARMVRGSGGTLSQSPFGSVAVRIDGRQRTQTVVEYYTLDAIASPYGCAIRDEVTHRTEPFAASPGSAILTGMIRTGEDDDPQPSRLEDLKTGIYVAFALFWPPGAPLGAGSEDFRRGWWKSLSVAIVIPAAAIFHHALFFRRTCMLNPFGPDYTPSVMWFWLSKDPSLPCALLVGVLLYLMGNRFAGVKKLVAPFFSSFVPLSIWIWDIPFSGRFICRNFHDGRWVLPGGIPVTTTYFYALGLVLYVTFSMVVLGKRAKIEEQG